MIKNRQTRFDTARMAARFEFQDARAVRMFGFTEVEVEERVRWISRCIRDGTSDFQRFLVHYFGIGSAWEKSDLARKAARLVLGQSTHWEKELNRFALSVGLVVKFCPPGGRWFDAGSLGHDALRVKLERPDIEPHLASYEGCILYLNETGLHYHLGSAPPPEPNILCQQLDLEKDRLDFPDGSVDLVTSFETLEHYKYAPQHFMLEANRVLKPSGRLLMTTPNGVSAAALARLLHGVHPAENPRYHRAAGHGRIHPLEYGREQLYDLVTMHGFEIELFASVNLTPFSDDEKAAIEAVREARASRLGSHPREFGEKWLLVARRERTVTELQYPPSLFE